MNSACKRNLAVCLTAILLSGCSGKKPECTPSMKKPSAMEAFCRSIDYSDTASLHKDKAMASHMKHIVRLMMKSDSTATANGLEIFFDGLGGDPVSLRLAFRSAYLFLGSPNSPVRDETLYLRFLSSLISRDDLPEEVSARAKDKAMKAMLNRPGKRANDFRYIDRDGVEGTLHSLRAPQTMLVFYDPECPHCPEILKKIAADSKVNAAIETGRLKVLAIYAEGKRDVWEKRKLELPERWTVAYDLTGVIDADLYDLPAMPIVYLLDSDKRVLVKDMPW